MADLDERLSQLISDQESMKKVLEIAKVIMTQRDSDTPAPAMQTSEAAPQQPSASPDLTGLLSSLLSQPSSEPPKAQEPAAVPESDNLLPLAAMLPQLLQALSGEGNLLKSDRVNLLQAMRPYLKENRLRSIDRALKLANVTKAATSAMHLIGR